MLRYLPFLIVLALWIYAFIDCLNTPEKEVRKLPKVVWAIIILLFGNVLLGSVAWFLAGRPRRNAPYGAVKPQERQWVAPDDNPEFLKSLGKEPPQAPREESPEPEADPKPETGQDNASDPGTEADEQARGRGPEDPPSSK
ncbi:PLDc N-terminal domain-containing protein [Streptomyces sp. ODS28]|uniref:PLDc N-terminal domain-containing protein n=1 Tax=Streptomyces sp. ODS28 TaxID=3136688 RepID=UPI0031E76CB1